MLCQPFLDLLFLVKRERERERERRLKNKWPSLLAVLTIQIKFMQSLAPVLYIKPRLVTCDFPIHIRISLERNTITLNRE